MRHCQLETTAGGVVKLTKSELTEPQDMVREAALEPDILGIM